MVKVESDIGRPDNRIKVYTTKHVAFGVVTILDVVGKLPGFRDVSATVLRPEGGIGHDPWGIECDGSEEHLESIKDYLKRAIPRLQKIDESKFEESVTFMALRARRAFHKLQEKREKRKK